ncbi:MAG: hypothetical protein EB164_09380 [Thaumarchaeota archaeon]|nr:hypothetical protein [Nitrososphaerota archaeon]
MGLADLISMGSNAFSIEDALDSGVSPKEIIMGAAEQSVDFLFSSAGNEGQLSIITNEIIPNLERATALALASAPEFDWEEITTMYPDAVGEMVEEVNNIMHEACRAAEELVQAIMEEMEDAMIEKLAEISPFLAAIWKIVDIISDLGEEAEDVDEDRRSSFF